MLKSKCVYCSFDFEEALNCSFRLTDMCSLKALSVAETTACGIMSMLHISQSNALLLLILLSWPTSSKEKKIPSHPVIWHE